MNNNETSNALVYSYFSALGEDLKSFFPHRKVELTRDFQEILKRFSMEGNGFICQRLPMFGKAIETSLITGSNLGIIPGLKLKKKSKLPTLLYCLTSMLFDDDGQPKSLEEQRLLNGTVLRSLRQTLSGLSKARDVDPSYDESIITTDFIRRVSVTPHIFLKGMWVRQARKLLKEVFEPDGQLHPSLAQWESNPFGRHGPGAVFGGETGSDKWSFGSIPGMDNTIFEYENESIIIDGDDQRRLNRLELVPKDYRGPRLICIEPKELQFAQQGLLDVITHIVETNRVTAQDIDFKDQHKSQVLCTRRDLCTIDLKDASDLVSVALIKLLFPKSVSRILLAYRSTHTLTSQGETPLTTYATMGNALCFPVETLVFWAISRASIPTNVTRIVRVYGDDMIVPEEYVDRILENLKACGLSVNYQKTCTSRTLIRESCGAFVFNGDDARIVQLKRTRCSGIPDWISLLDSARELLARGFPCTSLSICESVNPVYPVPYGYTGLPPYLTGMRSADGKFIRFNRELQRLEARMPSRIVAGRQKQVPNMYKLYAYFVGAQQRSLTRDTEKVEFVWAAL